MCHLYSAGLPPQCLVKLQFRNRLRIDSRIVQQPITPGFRYQVWNTPFVERPEGLQTLTTVIGKPQRIRLERVNRQKRAMFISAGTLDTL